MPTTRQLIAVGKLAEMVRNSKGQKNITLGKIMRAAGYSQSSSIKPTKLTESKGFKTLLEQYLPLELGHQVHKQLLQSAVHDSYRMDSRCTDKEIEEVVESIPGCKLIKVKRFKGESFCTAYYWTPDSQARSKAVDMLYKLHGTYAPEKHDVTATFDVVEITNYGKSPKKD